MRKAFFVLGGVLGGLSLTTACVADPPADGPGAGAGSGTGPGDINLGTGGAGECDGGICPDGIGGGSGADTFVDPGKIVEPEPDPCDADGNCADGFICTTANQCGEVRGSCTSNAECEGDTYCCSGAECRNDGLEEGVCIPGNVGPGTECKGEIQIGVFAPAEQCQWKGTDEWGPNVAVTPLVADLPNDSGSSAEIVFVSFTGDNSDTASKNQGGSIRIIRGDDCVLLETVEDSKNIVRVNTTPALADLTGDGNIEIVAYKKDGGLIAFAWDGAKYGKLWETAVPMIGSGDQVWSGLSIHNLDGGNPEILAGTEDKVHTFDSAGMELGTGISVGGGNNFNGFIPVVADLDNDGSPELLVNTGGAIKMLNWEGGNWQAPDFNTNVVDAGNASHFAVADFGTESGDTFDPTVLDGIAEVVKVEDSISARVGIFTLGGQKVMEVATSYDGPPPAGWESGGPPVVGDFDNDGFPEIGVAGASKFRVFDLDCAAGGAGCAGPYVRWEQASQDGSSRQTGASIFDFDGDGRAEAVYADECFLRVYDGLTGDVLFSSYRTSGTWYENPVVADADKDQNTEIIVNSAYEVTCPQGGTQGTPYVDPLHPGVPCDDDSSCVSGGTCSEGYCRCSGDQDCDPGLTCQAPLSGSGNTCRATHPNDASATGGIKVLRDRLDRWTSSLPIWNQHAYSVTNINVDGSVPTASEWETNFKLGAERNHFRQNEQGDAAPDDIPDVSGQLDAANLCTIVDNKVVLTGRVCNRGRKAVGSALPATFYDSNNNILCVSYTQTPVEGYGDCRAVSCQVDLDNVSGDVKMVVNDDGMGGRTTVECRDDNNEDSVTLEPMGCVVVK